MHATLKHLGKHELDMLQGLGMLGEMHLAVPRFQEVSCKVLLTQGSVPVNSGLKLLAEQRGCFWEMALLPPSPTDFSAPQTTPIPF